MTLYAFVEIEITSWEGMEPYRAAVNDTIVQYGGRFLVRGGTTRLIEGEPEPKTIVILEFPDAARFDSWWNSPEYQKILPNRLENSTARLFTVEGVKSPRGKPGGTTTVGAPTRSA